MKTKVFIESSSFLSNGIIGLLTLNLSASEIKDIIKQSPKKEKVALPVDMPLRESGIEIDCYAIMQVQNGILFANDKQKEYHYIINFKKLTIERIPIPIV